jgi:hypothetical protein
MDQPVVSELAAATKAYELSRARYIRTVTSDAEQKLIDAGGKRRDALRAEMGNLQTLARARLEARTAAMRAYAAKCPGRVNASGPLAPLPTSAFSGAEKLYRAALTANEEFNEIKDILVKRGEQLDEIEKDLRQRLADFNANLVQMLETPDGLANAFRRDPLLERAHTRMKNALAAEAAAANPVSVRSPKKEAVTIE